MPAAASSPQVGIGRATSGKTAAVRLYFVSFFALTPSLPPRRLPLLTLKREQPAADVSAAIPKRARDKRASPHPATDAHSSRRAACTSAHDGAAPGLGESAGCPNDRASHSRPLLPSTPPLPDASSSLTLENTVHTDADAAITSASSAPVFDVQSLCLLHGNAPP